MQRRSWRPYVGGFLWIGVWLTSGHFLSKYAAHYQEGLVTTTRNFYGVLRVFDDDLGKPYARRKLYHGRINHGQQFLDPTKRDRPTSYFGTNSGVGIALRRHPTMQATRDGLSKAGMKVGVIGLGVGTIASYARPHDEFTFYEINPEVERIAKRHFHFLSDAPSKIKGVMGDGRISLEKEFEANGPRQFDLFAVDAFSGDAIPIHLLTKEAFELYFKHLKPEGILCLHISNRHINLRPVVRTLADHFGMRSILIKNSSDRTDLIKSSSWILVTTNEAFLNHERVARSIRSWDDRDLEGILWTDDYSSLVEVLKH